MKNKKRKIKNDEIKSSYDEEYKYGKLGGPDFTHKWILKILRPDKGKVLLDIGCGQGLLLREAEREDLITYGVDISSEAVKQARRNSPSSEIICDDAHRLNWKEDYFDYITNIGSLEHFQKPEGCLKEMNRVVKKGGKVCIMLPNLHYYRHIINKLLWKREPTSYQLIERFASLREWKNFLEDNGFKVEKVYKYNKFNRPKILTIIRSLIIPLYFSHHFVFLCKKR